MNGWCVPIHDCVGCISSTNGLPAARSETCQYDACAKQPMLHGPSSGTGAPAKYEGDHGAHKCAQGDEQDHDPTRPKPRKHQPSLPDGVIGASRQGVGNSEHTPGKNPRGSANGMARQLAACRAPAPTLADRDDALTSLRHRALAAICGPRMARCSARGRVCTDVANWLARGTMKSPAILWGDRSPLHDRQGIPESASRELTSTTATIAVGSLVGSRVTIARPPKALRDMRCRGTGAETGQQIPPPSPAARLQL